MKIVIKLNKSNGDRGNGYEIIVYCNHLRTRKQKVIGYSKIAHFNEDMQLINEKHPDYEELLPRLMDIKLKARKIITSGMVDVEQAMQQLFDVEPESLSFIKFCEEYISELTAIALECEKRGDIQQRNRVLGNRDVNRNSLNQFKKFFPEIKFADLNYSTVLSFRQHYENAGASKRTIVHYISQLKSMYNKGVRKYKLNDTQPFKYTLDNLTIKSFNAKKKYIEIEDIKKLENFKSIYKATERNRDLFLLQFYFGGCDLIDLYFLPMTALFKDRVLIERSKTGQVANLKLHPKAKEIINRYKCDSGNWVFPWDKDRKKYLVFLSNYFLSLKRIQARLDIKILPTGGNLSVKVARHTFGNRAKQLMIDTDIIRELMVHERNDVDNFYKDKFSEEVRDQALFKIIDTGSI